MSKVRVYEIAKQLNMDQKSLVSLFQSMGIGDVRNHMSSVEVDVVDRLKRQLERQKSPEVVEERISKTVVKRRARAADPEAPLSASPGPASIPSARPSSGGAPEARGAPGPSPSSLGERAPSAPRSQVGDRPSTREQVRAPESTHGADAPVPASAPSASRADHHGEVTNGSGSSSSSATPAAASSVSGSAHAPEAAAAPTAKPSQAGGAPAAEAQPPSKRSSAGVAGPAPRSEAAASRRTAKESARMNEAVTNLDFDGDAAPASSVRESTDALSRTARSSATGAGAAPAAPATEHTEAQPEAPRVAQPPPAVAVAPPVVVAPPPPVARVEPARPTSPPTGPSSTAPAGTTDAPRRPSSPPRTGIDVWQGRPGVPMPQNRTTAPPARRTTYDPRATAVAPRPGAPIMGGFPGNRGGPGGRNRPGFRRPGMGGPLMPRKPVNVSTLEMSAHKKVIKIEEQVTLQQLAAKMSLKVTDVLMRLLSMGMSGVNINSTIDSDTAKILANEFGWTVEDVAVSEEATLEAAMGIEVSEDPDLEPRPPIVTVMGHVDHGKTSLLDRIRKAAVAAGEAGGITQHIGAYRVETPRGTVAFLDTPGHEAFTAMRARGAQATDIVILVVAADDGVMPQTKEAISHAQAAKVPIVVAVNKMDKPSADIEKIKRDLANLGLQAEEWGGQTIFAPVSALTGEGIDGLLEAVLLQAEVLELRASPKRRASGVVIEALLDRGRGPVARIMVQDGTLRPGDIVLAGAAWGKVRAMEDEFGRTIQSAGPSTPVEVLGLNEVPSAGDPVHAVKDGKTAEEIAETRRKKANKTLIRQDVGVSLEALKDRLQQEGQLELKLIIKGDVQGSVEAVASALQKLTTPKVKVTIVQAAVGGITEGDVNLAIASRAIIVGFNVRPAGKAAALAENGGIEIRPYNIIYNAVDDIRAAMEGLLPTTKIEKELGKADVRVVFRISKVGVVAGCYVTSGSVKRGSDARLVRDSVIVWNGKISSLRRVKEDVKEVAEGTECGISLDNYSDIKEGDIIESFEIEEVKTKLT